MQEYNNKPFLQFSLTKKKLTTFVMRTQQITYFLRIEPIFTPKPYSLGIRTKYKSLILLQLCVLVSYKL